MPRRDGTGPTGIGPINGRGAGFCNSDVNNRYVGRCFGGYGCQGGYNRRKFSRANTPGYYGNGYFQGITEKEEETFLENQKVSLENQLKLIEERLSNLNNSSEE